MSTEEKSIPTSTLLITNENTKETKDKETKDKETKEEETNAAPTENRKMATVQRISYVCPIDGKDRIVLAKVLGYQLIVDKTQFFCEPDLEANTLILDSTATPLCVYFETDTILDNTNPEFAFLKSRKWRIRTMKMSGVYSEGLALPLQVVASYGLDPSKLQEGQDLTKELKVQKYLSPEEMDDRYPRRQRRCGKGQSTDPRLGRYPVDIFPKTDEPNLKSEPFLLTLMMKEDALITVTEKFDGMSATYFNGRSFSRNYEHVPDADGICNENAIWYHRIRDKYNLLEKTQKHPTLAIQGEIVGPGANKNRLGLKELDFHVFNIYDTESQKYLTMPHVVKICQELELKTVPIIVLSQNISELPEYQDLSKMMSIAEKMKYPNDHPSEGIVVKSDSEDPKKRHSFKIVSRLYLDMIK